MLIKCIHRRFFSVSWFSQALPKGLALSETVDWYVEGLEYLFPEPQDSATKSFSSKSRYVPLVLSPCWLHFFDFGKVFHADLKQALLPAPQHQSVEAANVSSHGSKHHVVGKIVKSIFPKSAIFRCSRPFSSLPMAHMDSVWNFNSILTRNFSSSEAPLSFCIEWKSSKIADFPPPAWCCLGQT